jgi:hypothetical protein
MRVMPDLRKCHMAIKVLLEQNHALEWQAAVADELRHEMVVHLEVEVQAARTEREVCCTPHHLFSTFLF